MRKPGPWPTPRQHHAPLACAAASSGGEGATPQAKIDIALTANSTHERKGTAMSRPARIDLADQARQKSLNRSWLNSV
jgi:hypothetical protein